MPEQLPGVEIWFFLSKPVCPIEKVNLWVVGTSFIKYCAQAPTSLLEGGIEPGIPGPRLSGSNTKPLVGCQMVRDALVIPQ